MEFNICQTIIKYLCLCLIFVRLMASEFAPEDFISIMPDNVITNILHRLPLQDAVRTSILSRNWRCKWTMLNELAIDQNFFVYLIERKAINSFWAIISKVLLYLNSAITKCVLILTLLEPEDIHHLIMFLSKKGIKDLTLTFWSSPPVKLPSHLFSCLELTHLNITRCCFNPPPGFRGFPNLLSLELCNVQFGGSDLGEFLTRCPLLEILDIGYLSYTGSVKLVDIAKLENLKRLSLSLCHMDTNVFELVSNLPKLQELGLDFQGCSLTKSGAKIKFSTAFPFIKALNLTRIDSGDGTMLSCALEMIRNFPNLHTLEIFPPTRHVDDPNPVSIPIPSPEVEYSMMELRNVVFRFIKGSENEIHLIRYFLACSPSLKKIEILCDCHYGERLIFARKLLKLHRASPTAEIDFN
ncbi:F-box/FBD/LRR-repeat protein At1g13570-like [Bidens hawaiensis]|uniref:F-box/FBD/LRR-repeat protein At1g13570-like n=1 Tax=Bidens hawaiensis TaxID=980011 RepID=UPI00404A48F2